MNNMTFEEFVRTVKTTIIDYMSKDYEGASVDITTVHKPGDLKLTGLAIRPKNSNISPTFYLDGYYNEYKDSKSIETILCEIADNPAWHKDIMSDALPNFSDFNEVKDKIVAQLICRENNGRYLSERVSVPMNTTKLDTMFVIELSQDNDGVATISITYDMLDVWGVNVDDIVRCAHENTPRLRPALYSDMNNVISVMMGDTTDSNNSISKDSMMIVCSNRSKINGAIAILYPGVADEIRSIIGEFYVLPSSVHEVIIVPKAYADDINELYNMVHDVNETEVSHDEVLGNDVYMVKNGQLVSAMYHSRDYDNEIMYV